jgi:hypothetical protein
MAKATYLLTHRVKPVKELANCDSRVLSAMDRVPILKTAECRQKFLKVSLME